MRTLIFSLLVAAAGFVGATARADAPDWLAAAASLPTPATAGKAPAVVLLDESSVVVDAKGVATETHRVAIRVLHDAGRSRATGQVGYIGGADKIVSVGAWLVRGKETIETRKKSEWIDLATYATGAAVDEQRTMRVNMSDKALTNDVFGYETQVQLTLLIAEVEYGFGSELPVLTERFKVTLPPGFSPDTKFYGTVLPTASVSSEARTWLWTATDRPYRPEEPYESAAARHDAMVVVRLVAPAGFAPRSFANWAEVMAYCTGLNAEQCDSSPGLEAKVRELTAGCADDLAKIRALSSHVQKLRYIAINTGLRRGFGYKARKASTVFSTGYGDCKDKANLLVAMLRQVGVRAYTVSAYLGKDWVVQSDWPTPAQFNHAIVAIPVDEKIQLPAVVTTENLGRLLILDPTDSYTQVGDLGESLQGGSIHVEAPGNNVLTPLPVLPAQDDFKMDRRMEMKLAVDGAVTVSGTISAIGQTGARMRAQFEQASLPKDMEKLVTKQLSDKFRGATVLEKKAVDDPATGRCTLSFGCAQPNYLQWLQGDSAIVKLDVLSRQYLPNFAEKERLLPIYLPAQVLNDEIVLTIPPGFKVDELPATTALESSYGSCHVTYERAGDGLVLRRTVVLNQATIPVSDYAKLRQFLSDMAKADRTSLLLKRHG